MEGSADETVEETESGLMRAVDQFPFMVHVLLVLIMTWLFLSFTANSFLILCFFSVYLFKVAKRGRERERRRIASEERKRMNARRALSEVETLRWLNEGIKGMWPVCLEKFASKHFFGPMAPWFLNEYKPWGVNEVKLHGLHLGSTPPVFKLIRTKKHPHEDGDHVVFEAALEFVSGDDMNAEMLVQTTRRFGGFWTTFYISDLHIEGTVRISVKFLEGWPVVGRVRFCFAIKPYVTMSCRPLIRSGFDVSLIPGIANLVERMLDSALENSVVEPNMLVVDVEKLVSKMLFDDPRTQRAKTNGVTDFFQIDNKSTLLVEILEATNLKAADRNAVRVFRLKYLEASARLDGVRLLDLELRPPAHGFSDPFVEITFGQEKSKKTKVLYKTLNPKWTNEQHHMTIVNWDLPNMLTLRVRDKDRIGRSDELGICSVQVKDYRDGRRHEFNLPLTQVSKGYLKFAITVKSANAPQSTEEPRMGDAGRETQEIKTSGSAPNHTSPKTATVMKRSKSDTNLESRKTPPKIKGRRHSRHNSIEEISLVAETQGQTPSGDTYGIIEMPYGSPGAFTILHPGSLAPLQFPLPKKEDIQKETSHEKGVVDANDNEVIKSSKLRFFKRGKRKTSGTSQENALAEKETTMSEHSGYSSSLDHSTELKVLNCEPYHGTVKMNFVPPDTTEIAPQEPPEMYVLPAAPSQLQPIHSGKTPSTEAINLFFGSTNHNTGAVDETVPAGSGEGTSKGSPLSAGPGVESTATKVDEGMSTEKVGVDDSDSKQHGLRSPQRPPTDKQSQKTMADWWKKVKSLAKRAKKKKRHNNKGVEFSAELNLPTEDYAEGDAPLPLYHDDSDTSATQSFRLELLDVKSLNTGGALANRQGGSPELRKIINSRSRGAGSQSDRQGSINLRKFTSGAHTSRSFRHESYDLNRILPVAQQNRESSLKSIPEKDRSRRNGNANA